jgi:acyl-CoA reductase-like NAD-dependent aldehyde dehydrogenase
MIRESHARKVQDRIDAAVAQGASALVGGRQRADLGPTFVEPTVLVHVDPRQEIAVEETFGPVISLHRTETTKQAIALANDSAYGLNASLWTGGSSSALSLARELETGSVAINSSLMIYNAFDLPMGGIKKSGIGRRHGEHGILRYTQAQSIVRSFEAGGGYDQLLTKVRSDKAAAMMLKLVKLWRRVPGIR